MIKRIGITGVALVAVLALSGFMVLATASAMDVYLCYQISKAEAGKEGAYPNEKCETPTKNLLEGKWILAEPLVKTVEDLWCALIRLVLPGNISGEDGYYEDAKCTKKNKVANASDYTEIIIPEGKEMVLPEFKVEATGKSTSKAGTLFGVSEIKCAKDKDTQTATGKKTGTFSIDFEECKVLGEECHSLGDKSGVILTGGTNQLVLDTLAGTDHHLVLFEPGELHIECKFLSSLIVTRGNVLGTIVAIGAKKTEFAIDVVATSKTTQEYKEFENNASVKEHEHLESSLDEGTFEESGEDAGEDILTTEKETEIVN